MTDVITKVAIGGVEYPFAGGGSEGQEVVYLTQAEYDVLPASKLTDGKIYKVKTTGVVPGGSADASDVEYDNTTSGLIADNVQDAIDEVNSKSEQTITTTGDFLFLWNGGYVNKIYSTKTGYFFAYKPSTSGSGQSSILANYNGVTIASPSFSAVKGNYVISDSDAIYFISTVDRVGKLQYDGTFTTSTAITTNTISKIKVSSDYFYVKTTTSTTYIKVDKEGNVTTITQQEFDAIPDGQYYEGLWYTQDGNNVVAVNDNGTTVKTYTGVGTIDGICNGKIYKAYRQSDDSPFFFVAIATI